MTSEVYNIDCMEYIRTLPDKAFDLAVVELQLMKWGLIL